MTPIQCGHNTAIYQYSNSFIFLAKTSCGPLFIKKNLCSDLTPQSNLMVISVILNFYSHPLFDFLTLYDTNIFMETRPDSSLLLNALCYHL